MSLIVTVVIASLLGSFFCSLCEASLYGVTPTQVELLRRKRVRGSERLAKLRRRIDEPIAGIAAFNSLAQTVGAAWTGALVGERYGNAWLGAISAAFALTMLLLTEIVPKSIGLAWAGTLAPRLAWVMQGMVWLVYPIAILCRLLTRVITHRAPSQQPTEDEILVMADMAAQGGTILPDELRWVENVLHLNNVTVNQLMTPRQVVFSLASNLPLNSAELHVERLVHSRIPVTEDGDLNRVIGVVQRRTVLDHLIRDDCDKTIRELMRPTLFVPETWGGHQLLDRLMAERQHLAVVQDSSRHVVGVVTLEDVLEYLLGTPIVGEHDTHPEMQRMARERSRFRPLPPKTTSGQ
jgi:CBS domain containing-hemolysin-like protein